MSTENIIYYFTGTGNSLATARIIATGLGHDTELVPVARVWTKDEVAADAPSVGFVVPDYFYGLPLLVAEFVAKLELSQAEYIWAVITCKTPWKGGPLFELQRLLRPKGKRLNAGFYVRSVGNYVPSYDVPPKEVQKILMSDAGIEAGLIAGQLAKRTKRRRYGLLELLGPLLHRQFQREARASDANFWVRDSCNDCGICARICPVDDIRIVDGRPQWLGHCERCLACLHLCPEESIEYGKKTSSRGRYHHTYVNVRDIVEQKLGPAVETPAPESAPSTSRNRFGLPF